MRGTPGRGHTGRRSRHTSDVSRTRSNEEDGRMRKMVGVALQVLLALAISVRAQTPQAPTKGIQANLEHPVLPIGSPLPDFTLPGVDGRMHKASEYTGTKALAVVFESNHCPVSQLYEGRVEKLYADYRRKGVTLVAINPNNAKAVRLDELGYTDVTDSLDEMKIRAKF